MRSIRKTDHRVAQEKRVVIGTGNLDKLAEIRRLLRGTRIRVECLRDHPGAPEVVENGRTFEANARKKAYAYSRHARTLVLADDSGLSVSALNGKPGVYSARFAGPGCTYADNNEKLLRSLRGIPQERRKAKFVCVAALYDNGRSVAVVKGICRGRITDRSLGQCGFGYDPVFIPEGQSRTFAQMSRRMKNKLSHRGKALRAAKKAVLTYLRSSKRATRMRSSTV